MTDEELGNIWAQQPRSEGQFPISPEAIWRVAKASERFERVIFWRDAREWIATALIAGFLLFAAFSRPTIHWLLILAAFLVCLPMTYATLRRRSCATLTPSVTLADHLHDCIRSVQHQISLLRSVQWWYLTPLALSMLLMSVDRSRSRGLRFGAPLILSIAFVVAIFIVVWRLNKRAVSANLGPRLRQLEQTLRDLETEAVDSRDS